MAEKIKINRAPVLTLWAAIVAERLGYNQNEALTLAKAVTGLNAQSKGRRLGIYHERTEEEKPERQRQHKEEDIFTVDVLGRPVPVTNTKEGLRAVEKEKPISPKTVQRYLETRFGDALPEARKAMQELADSYTPEELRRNAYRLYEDFRPEIPEGAKGWGAKGELNLDYLKDLHKGKNSQF